MLFSFESLKMIFRESNIDSALSALSRGKKILKWTLGISNLIAKVNPVLKWLPRVLPEPVKLNSHCLNNAI